MGTILLIFFIAFLLFAVLENAFNISLSILALSSFLLTVTNHFFLIALDDLLFKAGLIYLPLWNIHGYPSKEASIYAGLGPLGALICGVLSIVSIQKSKGKTKGIWLACIGTSYGLCYIAGWTYFILSWAEGMASFGGSS